MNKKKKVGWMDGINKANQSEFSMRSKSTHKCQSVAVVREERHDNAMKYNQKWTLSL